MRSGRDDLGGEHLASYPAKPLGSYHAHRELHGWTSPHWRTALLRRTDNPWAHFRRSQYVRVQSDWNSNFSDPEVIATALPCGSSWHRVDAPGRAFVSSDENALPDRKST